MSSLKTRAALQAALNSMSPSVSTAWENVAFEPPAASTPYQKAFVLFAEPDNSEYGANYREQGIFQVSLMYPLQAGAGAAAARAELLRSTFKRGATFTNGGETVTVTRTPEIGNGRVDGDRWMQVVRIQFISGTNSS